MTLRQALADETGMTLIELLVGLGLLSLISLLMVGGLRLGLRAWEVGENRVVQGDRLERTDAFLRQLLAQSRIRFDDLRVDSPRGFLGRPDGIAFLAPLPEQFGGGGSYSFSLVQEENGATRVLVLHWQPSSPGTNASANTNGEAALIENMRSAQFSYFGRAVGETAASWHSDWSGHSGLPRVIRLDLTGLLSPGPASASLYFSPKLAGGG